MMDGSVPPLGMGSPVFTPVARPSIRLPSTPGVSDGGGGGESNSSVVVGPLGAGRFEVKSKTPEPNVDRQLVNLDNLDGDGGEADDSGNGDASDEVKSAEHGGRKFLAE